MSSTVELRWEDLLVNVVHFREAMRGIGNVNTFMTKHQATDFRAQQEVAAAERFFERILNLVVELIIELLKLAEPGYDLELDRLSAGGALGKAANLGVIPRRLRDRLDDLREERNVLQHGYSLAQPQSIWRGMDELDDTLISLVIDSLADAFANKGLKLCKLS